MIQENANKYGHDLAWRTRTQLVFIDMTKSRGMVVGYQFIPDPTQCRKAIVFDRDFGHEMAERVMRFVLGMEAWNIDFGIKSGEFAQCGILPQLDYGVSC